MTSPTRRVAVVAPHGDLGVDDCAALRLALRTATDSAELLVVDLLDATVTEEAPVEVLVGAGARCAARGVRFVVANACTPTWTVLTRARVNGVLRVHRRGTPPLSDLIQLIKV